MRKRHSHIGLDIGTTGARAVELRGKPSVCVVGRWGTVDFEAGAVEHGDIQHPEVVAGKLTELFRSADLPTTGIVVGINNRRVAVREITLPTMSAEDRVEAIKWAAAEHIPIPVDEAVLDHVVVSSIDGEDTITVVAAERRSIDRVVEATRMAGLEIARIEVNAWANARALAGAVSASATASVVDVGGGVADVSIVHRSNVRLLRTVDTSAAIAQVATVNGPAMINDPDISTVVDAAASSIDFWLNHMDGSPVDRIVVTGGRGSSELAAALAEECGIEVVDHAWPSRIPIAGVDRNDPSAQRLLVAVGLAVGALEESA